MKAQSLLLILLLFFQFNLACTSNQNSNSGPAAHETEQTPAKNGLPESPGPNDLVVEDGKYVMPTNDGRSMVFNYQKGSKESVWLLIHGLADDMNMLNSLAELAHQSGHTVLKVDLQGHGETLKEYLKTHDQLPEKLDYMDNVVDIQIILSALKIQEVTIVGHSYGGGIAYALATELKRTGSTQVKTLHMLAPYVQRIDKFIRESYPSLTRRYFPQLSPSDAAVDSVMDPILDQFMQTTYRAYIMENLYGSSTASISAEQKKEVDQRVQTAILATKGIRPFDLLDSSQPLPVIGSPLQVIGGKKDTLVLPKQLQAFEKRLKNENFVHELIFLDGPNSTHLFPRLAAKETYQLILNYQKAH